MNIDLIQRLLESINGVNFEKFVFDLLASLGRFDDIQLHTQVKGCEVDVVAKEFTHKAALPTTWYIETSVARVLSVDKLRHDASKLQLIRNSGDPNARILVVTSGSLTSAAKEFAANIGIEIWDSTTLARIVPESLLVNYFEGAATQNSTANTEKDKAQSLLNALQSIEPGSSDSMAYQRLVSEILEFLFVPPLETPRFEIPDGDARNRRDMIFENACATGFWANLRSSYAAHYIVVDAKNYSAGVDKGPVIDIAHYLKPYGCGMFGVLATRHGASGAGLHAMREQWIGNQKMIVALDDDDIKEMLRVKSESGAAEEIIRSKIATFRMAL